MPGLRAISTAIMRQFIFLFLIKDESGVERAAISRPDLPCEQRSELCAHPGEIYEAQSSFETGRDFNVSQREMERERLASRIRLRVTMKQSIASDAPYTKKKKKKREREKRTNDRSFIPLESRAHFARWGEIVRDPRRKLEKGRDRYSPT